MAIRLPTFKGYTVDKRLREFRLVKRAEDGTPEDIDFVAFASAKGQQLLAEMVTAREAELPF